MPITPPTNSHYGLQWNLALAKVPEAWNKLRDDYTANTIAQGDPGDLTFGSENIIITFLDRGILSTIEPNAVSTVLAFQGNVTNGLSKFVGFRDFITTGLPDDNFILEGAHGTFCGGVACANVDSSLTPQLAIVGVAANARMMSVRVGGTGAINASTISDGILWASNINQLQSGRSVINLPPGVRTDIISASIAISPTAVNAAIIRVYREAIDYSLVFGRDGRGTIIVFAAGNENTISNTQTLFASFSDKIIIAGATAVTDNTDKEVRAIYSNFGSDVHICAPAGDGDAVGFVKKATLTAAVPEGGDFNASPDVSIVMFTVDILFNVSGNKTGYTRIKVYQGGSPSVNGLFRGQSLAVGSKTVPGNYETRSILLVDRPNNDIYVENFRITRTNGTAGEVSSLKLNVTTNTVTDHLQLNSIRHIQPNQDVWIGTPAAGVLRTITSIDNATPNTVVLNNAVTANVGDMVLVAGAVATVQVAVVRTAVSPRYQVVNVNTTLGFRTGMTVKLYSGPGTIAIVRLLEVVWVNAGAQQITVDMDKLIGTIAVNFFFVANGYGDYLTSFAGTSASTPFVAGVSALMLSVNPELSWLEARELLARSAEKIDLSKKEYWKDASGADVFGGFPNGLISVNDSLGNDLTRTLTQDANVGDRIIHVVDAVEFKEGQAIRVGNILNEEYTVVRKVDATAGTLSIRPAIENHHATGQNVKGGRIAYKTSDYGFGRVDAELAVEMANDYKTDRADLFIRDTLADDGTGTVAILPEDVDSPDIWVRTTHPDADAGNYPPDYNTAGPHELPDFTKDNWIYVRVKNRGTRPSPGGMEVRLTLTFTNLGVNGPMLPDDTLTFPFPDFWFHHIDNDMKTVFLTPVPGPSGVENNNGYDYSPALLPAQPNPDLKPHVLPSLLPGEEKTIIIPWPLKPEFEQKNGATNYKRVFIKAHLHPFDGSFCNAEVHENNNLTFKEIKKFRLIRY